MSTGHGGTTCRDSATVRLRMLNEATGNSRQVRAHTVAHSRKHVSRSVNAHASWFVCCHSVDGRRLRDS